MYAPVGDYAAEVGAGHAPDAHEPRVEDTEERSLGRERPVVIDLLREKIAKEGKKK